MSYHQPVKVTKIQCFQSCCMAKKGNVLCPQSCFLKIKFPFCHSVRLETLARLFCIYLEKGHISLFGQKTFGNLLKCLISSRFALHSYSKVPIIRTGPIIHTVLIFQVLYNYKYRTISKNVDRTVYFYYCTAFPIISTVLIFLGTVQIYVPYDLKK